MIGADVVYFADTPVVITLSDLDFPPESPIKVCRVQVMSGSDNDIVGDFSAEAGNSTEISFDISSALRAMWNEYDFSGEIGKALEAISEQSSAVYFRQPIPYRLKALTEYIDPLESLYMVTESPVYDGGECIIGGFTELERCNAESFHVNGIERANKRYGDGSTKPFTSPERVGKDSITSWTSVSFSGTRSIFYPSSMSGEEDDPGGRLLPYAGHPPFVLRDDVPYVDFLFVNRRGVVESCSARMLESLGIPVESRLYSRIGTPSYVPSRNIASVATGGRRSWAMSSGYQTREWAEWWTLEFLMARRHWMLYGGTYIPVVVTPARKDVVIYDRTKQQMPSVEFTVTLAFEG